MILTYPNESWKEVQFESTLKLRYAISNQGRFVSFEDSVENGRLLNCANAKGFRVFRYSYTIDDEKVRSQRYLHRMVAEYFLPTPPPEYTYVLHLDYNLSNNSWKNLCWATKEQMVAHQNSNPKIIEARKKSLNSLNRTKCKLNEAKVKILKKKLSDPNRRTRIKMIARLFEVSEMQLYRIKRGENWGHVK